jgi:CheY-like chemotaxis protein
MSSVVFVSSDMAAREYWTAQLSALGVTVSAVQPGPQAGAALASSAGAIVLHLNCAADWQHAAAVSRQPLHGPLVALTPWTAPDGRFRRLAFGIGCHAFVQAPCSASQLLSVIDRVAAGESQVEIASHR